MKKTMIWGLLVAVMITFGLEGASWARKGHRGPMQDTNGDGVVTLDEVKVQAEKKFSRKDTNGDGVITKEEVMAKVETKFKEIDTNGDGQVTHEEKKAHWEAKKANRGSRQDQK